MRLVNGWRGPLHWDKLKVGLRVSYLTLFCIEIHCHGHIYNLTLLNFRFEFGQ